jgi:hypothetical protein
MTPRFRNVAQEESSRDIPGFLDHLLDWDFVSKNLG